MVYEDELYKDWNKKHRKLYPLDEDVHIYGNEDGIVDDMYEYYNKNDYIEDPDDYWDRKSDLYDRE